MVRCRHVTDPLYFIYRKSDPPTLKSRTAKPNSLEFICLTVGRGASLFLVILYPENYYEKLNERDGVGNEKCPLVLLVVALMFFLKNLVFLCVGRQVRLRCPIDTWEVLGTIFVCVSALASTQS